MALLSLGFRLASRFKRLSRPEIVASGDWRAPRPARLETGAPKLRAPAADAFSGKRPVLTNSAQNLHRPILPTFP
jgi:hypothetical protein